MEVVEDYNTQKEPVTLKEYGRNVQMIAEHILTISDKDKRSKMAATLVELMKQINPSIKDGEDVDHTLWDHLHIISDFKLDVDSPYPVPDKEVLEKKPEKVDYNMNNLSHKHYGFNVKLLAKSVSEMSDPKEKKDGFIYLGKLMKRFYITWNKETPDDITILNDLEILSGEKGFLSIDEIKENNLFHISAADLEIIGNNNKRENRGKGRSGKSGGGKGRGKRSNNNKGKRY